MVRQKAKEGRSKKTEPRNDSDSKSPACCVCWYKKQPCQRKAPTICCGRCQRDLRKLGSEAMPIAPCLEESEAISSLHNLIASTSSLLSQNDHQNGPTVTIQITTNQHTGPTESTSITVGGPFHPSNEDLRRDMDALVETNLGLKIHSTDNESRLVELACLAGGYLCLMFPVRSVSQVDIHTPRSKDEMNESNLKRHFVKFSAIRFDQLRESIFKAVRSLDYIVPDSAHHTPPFNCLNAVAAAGILFCQLDHVKQGFLNGGLELLCNDIGFERTLKTWINSLSDELLWRLRKTCGKYPIWAEAIQGPWSASRRRFDLVHISLNAEWPSKMTDSEYTSRTSTAVPDLVFNTATNSAFQSQGSITPSEDRSPDFLLMESARFGVSSLEKFECSRAYVQNDSSFWTSKSEMDAGFGLSFNIPDLGHSTLTDIGGVASNDNTAGEEDHKLGYGNTIMTVMSHHPHRRPAVPMEHGPPINYTRSPSSSALGFQNTSFQPLLNSDSSVPITWFSGPQLLTEETAIADANSYQKGNELHFSHVEGEVQPDPRAHEHDEPSSASPGGLSSKFNIGDEFQQDIMPQEHQDFFLTPPLNEYDEFVFNSMSLSSSLSVPPQTLDWDWSLESTNTLRGLNTEPLFTPDSPKQ